MGCSQHGTALASKLVGANGCRPPEPYLSQSYTNPALILLFLVPGSWSMSIPARAFVSCRQEAYRGVLRPTSILTKIAGFGSRHVIFRSQDSIHGASQLRNSSWHHVPTLFVALACYQSLLVTKKINEPRSCHPIFRSQGLPP
jgi:hypothetical protein